MSLKATGDYPKHADVLAALEAVIVSPAFSKSSQLASFLRFVVGEALAGRSGRIKAYTIATTALGRDEDFDPQSDPIVRVEAGRLRRALHSYYTREGRDAPVQIDLPVGSYVPVFRANPKRRPAGARLLDIGDHLMAFVRANPRQVLIIALAGGITGVVTCEIIRLVSDELWLQIADAFWPDPTEVTGGIAAEAGRAAERRGY